MLKKLLLRLTIASALALGVSSLAYASNAPGPYIGGQLGWGDTHNSLGELPGNSAVKEDVNAFNAIPWSSSTSSTSSNSDGLAGRLFIGYQFNPNWAAEFGYAQFRDANIKGNYTGNLYGFDTVNYSYKGIAKTHAFDLLGKGILPLNGGFSVFGKLGIAYVQQTTRLNEYLSDTDNILGPRSTNNPSKHNNRFMPVAGVGVSYDITPNVPVDLSWLHYQKVGGSIPNADLLSLGIAYKFNI